MYGHKTRLNSAAYSSVADWFALNSNELTWIALVTVGVIAVGMFDVSARPNYVCGSVGGTAHGSCAKGRSLKSLQAMETL